MKAYKVFTHDLCSPIHGGSPGWDGSLPYRLPIVEVDQSEKECGRGWNACRDIQTALRISGLWPNGWPSRVYVLESVSQVVERNDKVRSSTWDVISEVGDDEIEQAIREWTATWACEHTDRMADEQIAWRRALARPGRDVAAVEAGLVVTLDARRLCDWTLRRYDDAWSARAAWSAWSARAARDAWAARAAWDARAAWAARDAWAARAVRAARDAWDAWTAWTAWSALTLTFAAIRGLISHQPDFLTVGLRDAYSNGLAIAIPTGRNELGWAMVEG